MYNLDLMVIRTRMRITIDKHPRYALTPHPPSPRFITPCRLRSFPQAEQVPTLIPSIFHFPPPNPVPNMAAIQKQLLIPSPTA